jgi:carbonic anhydrase/acetyltransferase-like protein (isoleucine patch superfamily)
VSAPLSCTGPGWAPGPGAGAVVTNDMVVPAKALAVGVPAKIKEDRSRPELIELSAQVYVDNAARFRRGMRRLD